MTKNVHFSSATMEHYTPPHIINLVCACLGNIDLDPCSNSAVSPNVPATRHYTAAENGLVLPWKGRVYMNPPYGREIKKWVSKLVIEYQNQNVSEAIALVPARTDTAWFNLLADFPVCFVEGRLKFIGNKSPAPFPSAIFYLGCDHVNFCRCFGAIGNIFQIVRYRE